MKTPHPPPRHGAAQQSDRRISNLLIAAAFVRRERLLPDGTKIASEVPASAYRALRWQAAELAPGRALTANLRACVAADNRPR